MRKSNSILPRLGLIALWILLPMAMLYPLWTNPVSAGEDDVVYYYPLRKMVGQALAEGRWPDYNPLEATGVPLAADPQTAIAHPPTWLFAALPARTAYSVSIFLAFSLAGAGTWMYLRRIGLRRRAALIGSVVFMFCGFLVGHRVHLSVLQAAAYLPWGLWGLETLREKPARGLAILVPVGFLTMAAGHWPTLVHMGMIWAAYLLLRVRPLGRSLAVAAVAAVLVLGLLWPQISLTGELLKETTRHRIGYAMAGENSFLPSSMILAVFPMIMGLRTPNFYPQEWWGSWHHSEMLGYVGLLSLVLAAACVWRFYRRPRAGALLEEEAEKTLRPLVRAWTWLAIGAGVFMLGYYLPTYQLIHRLPVLGVMRCPARMVLGVDMALAVLAAIAVHHLSDPRNVDDRLVKFIRRGATILLPLAMLAMWGTLAFLAWGLGENHWPQENPLFVGGARQVLQAVQLGNPAVWVPLAMAILTGLAVRYWVVCPNRRSYVVLAVLLADLFMVARFIDMPPAEYHSPDPDTSPAQAWLAEHAVDEPFRVWGMGETYTDRPDELLLAKTCEAMGLATISNYGPFQSPAHAQLLGFRIFGTARDWPRLVRTNYLLSLYNVRYLIASDVQRRAVIESVRILEEGRIDDGENLLSSSWNLFRVESQEGVLCLRTPVLWSTAQADQPVRLEPNTVYRIALDARGPDGGAANFLRADVFHLFPDGTYLEEDGLALVADSEQIGPQWRHFEWTFNSGPPRDGQDLFRLLTMSERPIEVRQVFLRKSRWPQPVNIGNRLAVGDPVYVPVAEFPAKNAWDYPVVIYENTLCQSEYPLSEGPTEPDLLEKLKWQVSDAADIPSSLPDLAIAPLKGPGRREFFVSFVSVFGYVLVWGLVLFQKKRKNLRRSQTPVRTQT